MIQHIWTVPCRVGIVDQNTNNVSLIDVLEEITVSELPMQPGVIPAQMPSILDVVSLWGRENPDQPEAGWGRLSLISPQGESLVQQPGEVDLRQFRRVRAFNKFIGLPLRGPGRYYFHVERRPDEAAEWELVARVPLDITIAPALEQPQHNGEAAPVA
jgi:hypothetical protein